MSIEDFPTTVEGLSKLSWTEINKLGKDCGLSKAQQKLQTELTQVWNEAREEKNYDLEKDLGIVEHPADIEQGIILEAWRQALTGSDQTFNSSMSQCLSDSSIWPEFTGLERDLAVTSCSHAIELFESSQVPRYEQPMFTFNESKRKYVNNTKTNMADLGRKMVDHQHNWWKEREASGKATLSNVTNQIKAIAGKYQ